MAPPKALVLAAREGLMPQNAPAATQLMLDLGATTDAVSLEITNPNISYKDWETIGKMCGFVGNAWQWWIGDWLNSGELLFGEQSAQGTDTIDTRFDLALRVTGREAGTLANIRSVCEKVPKDRRRPELTFAHHQEVAPLEPDAQEEWLAKAIEENWNRSQLREAIRASRQPIGEGEGGDGGSGSGSGGGGSMTIGERIELAARELARAMQPPLEDGMYRVPEENAVRLLAALGME